MRRVRMDGRIVPRLLLLAALACSGVVGLLATHVEAASQSPRVVGIVSSPAGPRLRPLDARTLKPVPGSWSRAVPKGVSAALSPSGARFAIWGSDDSLLVLDTATGRIVRKYRDAYPGYDLYWLGGDGTVGSRRELLVSHGEGCSSQRCGPEYSIVASGDTIGFGSYPEREAALEDGLVFVFEPTLLDVYGTSDVGYISNGIELLRMPQSAPFGVVADVAHDRVFVISSGGLVAQIERVFDFFPRIRYHRVDLNGRPFSAVWVGAHKIALWGEDGLGTIDTRTWRTQAVARDVTSAVATPLGLATWNRNTADGLTVYRPDGKKRFRVLAGKRVSEAFAVGDYLYADADARYSVDLRSGKVAGPLRRARIIVPDLVSIP